MNAKDEAVLFHGTSNPGLIFCRMFLTKALRRTDDFVIRLFIPDSQNFVIADGFAKLGVPINSLGNSRLT